ncbi:SPOR domain-containing protein [Deinococcus apachensis]|uniref:SPOR domain-containing protein n=1 Tax=Deinococcus apachensis TaxID=309886 RepID=UPI0003A2F471|nr:SPOR domain-containing protein [Deinococcus apachensis]
MSGAQGKVRRWPDLLIGLLVLLLLGGFGVLLLGQRAPQVQVAQAPSPSTSSTPSDTPPPPVIPGAPGTDLGTGTTEATTETPDNSATAGQDTGSPSPQASTPQTDNPPATAEPSNTAPEASAPNTTTDQGNIGSATSTSPAPTASNSSGAVPVVPAEPIPAAPEAPPTPQVDVPNAPPSSTVEPSTSGTTTPAPAVPARAGGAVATSEQRTPLRSDYRISLGTFGSEGAAQSRTEGVRTLGYTVYPIDVGSQVVAQVGPFADEATARQALADIQRVYPRALLYPPRNRSLTGGSGDSAASTPDTTSTPATPTPTPTPATPAERPTSTPEATNTPETPSEATTPPAATPAPAPSGPVYLQVGAFDRVESAQRLVGLLRDQGYAPTVNAPEGGKVTVLIGPFSGEAVTDTEAKLDASGFDHFRVR